MKSGQNGIEHKSLAKQISVQEGASAPTPQVEQKNPPLAPDFALEGQDTLGQDCSPKVCRDRLNMLR